MYMFQYIYKFVPGAAGSINTFTSENGVDDEASMQGLPNIRSRRSVGLVRTCWKPDHEAPNNATETLGSATEG
jgi:hypothetical protein